MSPRSMYAEQDKELSKTGVLGQYCIGRVGQYSIGADSPLQKNEIWCRTRVGKHALLGAQTLLNVINN
jgi:hypothetical protein